MHWRLFLLTYESNWNWERSNFQGIQINFAPPRPAGFANFRGAGQDLLFCGAGRAGQPFFCGAGRPSLIANQHDENEQVSSDKEFEAEWRWNSGAWSQLQRSYGGNWDTSLKMANIIIREAKSGNKSPKCTMGGVSPIFFGGIPYHSYTKIIYFWTFPNNLSDYDVPWTTTNKIIWD